MFLLVAAAFIPARIYVANTDKFPHPERILVVAAVLFLIGLFWSTLLTWCGLDRMASLASAIALVGLLGTTGGLSEETSTTIAVAVTVAGATTVALLASRFGTSFARFLVRAATVFFLLSLTVSWVLDSARPEVNSSVEASHSTLPETLTSRPDIYLVLLDGFPGARAMSEIYEADLTNSGSMQLTEAWASYPMTIASVASVLEMGYPLGDGDVVGGRTADDLARIMSGENRLLDFLASQGYRTHQVESGYSSSFCSTSVDVCVESQFLDEGIFGILDQTVIRRELRERMGSAFTQSGLHAMRWLGANLPGLTHDTTPDFVFASVAIPHPPLLLDRDCSVDYEFWRVGNSVFAGEQIIEERRAAYMEQVQCVAAMELELSQLVPDTSILIFFSDHGGDSSGQMSRYEHDWTSTDVLERMNAHLAVQAPAACLDSNEVFLSEMMRDVLWCLSGDEPDLSREDSQIFTASRIRDSSSYRLRILSGAEMEALSIPSVSR